MPDRRIEIIIPEDNTSLGFKFEPDQVYQQLIKTSRKTIGYFDEQITLYVIVPAKVSSKDKLNLEIHYGNNRSVSHTLDQPICNKDVSIWKFQFIVTPGRNSSQIDIKAHYEQTTKSSNEILDNFKQLNSLNFAGIELLNGSSFIHEEKNRQEETVITGEESLRISPIYQMLFRNVKSEKILTCLELLSCQTVKDMNTKVVINSINIQIANCELIPYTDIRYPVTLGSSLMLTLVYKLINNDNKTVKPIIAIINATIDSHKTIITRWTTNIDLQPTSKNAPALLPPPKMNSYNNLNSITLPKSSPLQKTRSASCMSNGSTSSKRLASFRLKSSSNVSLNHYSSQNFKRGLTISVSGLTKVRLGDVFKWKLQLMNKSTERMELILYVQSSIKKQYEKSIPPIPIQNLNSSSVDPIPLFTNSQLVKSFYYKFNKVGLVSLTNNLRINLDPGNLFESELELISIEKGLFNLYDFKVLDVISGETFECNKLLDVLVV